MLRCIARLLPLLAGCTAFQMQHLSCPSRMMGTRSAQPIMADEPATQADGAEEVTAESVSVAPKPGKFDLKAKAKEASKKGAGFNQFDPVLSATSFISRRFGLAGGLGLVALLASTEGNEILKSLTDTGPVPGSGEIVTTSSGLKYKDILVSNSGNAPLAGSVVGIKAKVSIADKVLFDTANDKPIAFRYGKRPFENVLCEGVEEGVKGMKAGGVRELTVPSALAPKGIELPPGVPLTYVIEVTEVLPGYF